MAWFHVGTELSVSDSAGDGWVLICASDLSLLGCHMSYGL